MSRIEVKRGDRWTLIGRSGSGKTFASVMLIKALLRLYNVPLFIFNTKPEKDLNVLGRPIRSQTAPKFGRRAVSPFSWNKPGPQVINWIPDYSNPIEEYAAALSYLYRLGTECIFLIDELSNFTKNRSLQGYPIELEVMQKQARSLGITSVICSQSSTYIPPEVIGQAEHLITFKLRDKEARRKIMRETGQEDYDIPDKYGCFYTKLDSDDPTAYYPSIQALLHMDGSPV